MSDHKETNSEISISKTRNLILDAALEVFSRKGYHATRMDEIVDQSGTSKGAIYFHFPNKERLFLALVDQFADLLERNVISAIAKEPAGMERVQVALETCLNTFERYRMPAKILLVQAVGLGAAFESARTAINDRFAKLIAAYLQEAVKLQQVPPVNTDVISIAWMGAIYAVVIRWVSTGSPTPTEIMQSLVPALLQSVGYKNK